MDSHPDDTSDDSVMSTSDGPERVPGWYRLPGHARPRYWDGSKWTQGSLTNQPGWKVAVVVGVAVMLLFLLGVLFSSMGIFSG